MTQVRVAEPIEPDAETPRPIPGPKGGLLGSMREVQRAPLTFFRDLQREHGDVAGFRFLFWPAALVSHPDGVSHVLHDHHRNYTKETVDYRVLKVALGEGLVTSEGELWRRQRRIVQPMFHRERIEVLGTVMTDAAQATLDRWDAGAPGHTVDMAAEMMRLTLRIVGQALFSVDLAAAADRFAASFTTVNAHLAQFDVSSLVPYLPTPRNWRFWRALRTMDDIVYRMIRARRDGAERMGDVMDMLLEARDAETGQGMDDRQLRDEVVTLLAAGHETTANALAWTWYLLAQHPEEAARLRAELATVLGGRTPTIDDLPQLPYTRMVIEESMRLYPPAWAIARAPLEDDVIGGCRVRAGTLVLLAAWVTHRHPDIWERPDAFEPERFTPARVAARPRYAYFPFGGGPRLCVGNTFALTEAQLVLATIAQRYAPTLAAGHSVEPEPLITLRPKNGLPMQLRRVDGAPR